MTKLLDDYECCDEVGFTVYEVTSDDDEPATQCASAVAAPGLPSSSLTPLPRQSLLHLVSEYPSCIIVLIFPVFCFP